MNHTTKNNTAHSTRTARPWRRPGPRQLQPAAGKLASGADRGQLELTIPDLGSDRRRIALDWLAQWTAPLRYTKHPASPIYGPSKSGAWDSWTNGVSIVPTADGQTYRMYYAGNKGEGIGFAEAAVADPVTWREHPASPVLTPRSDNWEGNLINQPRVVKVTETHWRMYYTGWGFQGPGTAWALGLAESFDGGTTWQRHGDQPILDRGDASSPDGAGACVPMAAPRSVAGMMWYTAGQINDKGHQNIHLCLATSADGLHWDKHPGNPVLTDDFADGAARSVTSRCYVRHDDGVFRMWYSFAKPDYRIHYAESLDGITGMGNLAPTNLFPSMPGASTPTGRPLLHLHLPRALRHFNRPRLGRPDGRIPRGANRQRHLPPMVLRQRLRLRRLRGGHAGDGREYVCTEHQQ